MKLWIAILTLASLNAAPTLAAFKCSADSVMVGSFCLDRYEATVWRIPDPLQSNKGLVKKLRKGKATIADLEEAGATRLGLTGDDYAPCGDHAESCVNDIYAVSLPNERPSAYSTWFQAQQACSNSGKRLPSNAEWQQAVVGTPDPGADDGTVDCNSTYQSAVVDPVPGGSRSGCVSSYGVADMVGNLAEWVADWTPRATGCASWGGSADLQCLSGAATSGEPAALLRGGSFTNGANAGPLTTMGLSSPSLSGNDGIGFRCAR
ncbi:MAG TPA: SUMF1/EgtB/PvdO family nonheme iron enzyme [Terriglobales bacterium]|nr:SUMF1/EgtB/PvdO family nonheme iron enzyme [Terriglobales bacterium]